MTELSPAAQAVKDAVIALYSDQQQIRDWGWRLDAPTVAAALEAAADQVVPEERMPDVPDFPNSDQIDPYYEWLCRRAIREWLCRRTIRSALLAIAAELKAQ